MTPKEVFLEDLKKEQLTTGLPNWADEIVYRVGVSVMRHHSKYFKPNKYVTH